MTARQINDLLEEVGDNAPRLDPQSLASAARLGATRRRRQRLIAIPAGLAVVVVIVATAVLSRSTDPAPDAPGGTQPTAAATSAPAAIDGQSVGGSYTCCSIADVTQPAHPGSTFRVHWIKPDPPITYPVNLTAELVGPYTTVDAAKAEGAAHHYRATLVAVEPPYTTAPVSIIHVPASATPGYYNLVTGGNYDEASGSGGTTTVRITR